MGDFGFRLGKRRLYFICAHDETFCVVAMCVCNPDHSPLRIDGRDPAQTPAAFVEIVSDEPPVPHPCFRVASRVIDSNSKNAASFSSARAMTRFSPSRVCNPDRNSSPFSRTGIPGKDCNSQASGPIACRESKSTDVVDDNTLPNSSLRFPSPLHRTFSTPRE